jgi:hypothetical protein
MKRGKKISGNVIRVTVSLICIAISGVLLWVTRNPQTEPAKEETKQEQETQAPEIAKIDPSEGQMPEVTQISLAEELDSDETSSAVSGEGGMITKADPGEQPIQETPEIPEVPTTLPELAEGVDLEDPDKVPGYKEDPKPTEKPADTVVTKPSQDDGHPGQIYVPGFGWIDRGEPNQNIYDSEMYMNGNKIGDM